MANFSVSKLFLHPHVWYGMSLQGMGASQRNGETPNCDVLLWGRRPKFCDTPAVVRISEKYSNIEETKDNFRQSWKTWRFKNMIFFKQLTLDKLTTRPSELDFIKWSFPCPVLTLQVRLFSKHHFLIRPFFLFPVYKNVSCCFIVSKKNP